MVLFIQLLGEIFLSFILVVSSTFYTFASDEDISEKVDYEIEAHLETNEKMIIGNEIITWTNNSDRPIRAVYINLYMMQS